jgi:hypothetical protein
MGIFVGIAIFLKLFPLIILLQPLLRTIYFQHLAETKSYGERNLCLDIAP